MKTIPGLGDFKIKDFLPWGVQTEIADELNVPKTYVSEVLRGKRFDKVIFKAILERAIIEKKKVDEYEKDIQKLIQELKS